MWVVNNALLIQSVRFAIPTSSTKYLPSFRATLPSSWLNSAVIVNRNREATDCMEMTNGERLRMRIDKIRFYAGRWPQKNFPCQTLNSEDWIINSYCALFPYFFIYNNYYCFSIAIIIRANVTYFFQYSIQQIFYLLSCFFRFG